MAFVLWVCLPTELKLRVFEFADDHTTNFRMVARFFRENSLLTKDLATVGHVMGFRTAEYQACPEYFAIRGLYISASVCSYDLYEGVRPHFPWLSRFCQCGRCNHVTSRYSQIWFGKWAYYPKFPDLEYSIEKGILEQAFSSMHSKPLRLPDRWFSIYLHSLTGRRVASLSELTDAEFSKIPPDSEVIEDDDGLVLSIYDPLQNPEVSGGRRLHEFRKSTVAFVNESRAVKFVHAMHSLCEEGSLISADTKDSVLKILGAMYPRI